MVRSDHPLTADTLYGEPLRRIFDPYDGPAGDYAAAKAFLIIDVRIMSKPPPTPPPAMFPMIAPMSLPPPLANAGTIACRIVPPTPPPSKPAKEFPKVPRLLSGMAVPAAFPPATPLIRLMMRLVMSIGISPSYGEMLTGFGLSVHARSPTRTLYHLFRPTRNFPRVLGRT